MIERAILSIIQNRELVWEMTLRDLKGLTRGAVLSYSWLVISPLIQVVSYVVIVSFVFGSRLGEDSGPFDYALYVLSGMIPWQIITKSLQDAPSLIRQRMALVKQVIYPIETLPLSSLLVGSFGSLVSFTIFLILAALTGGLRWSYLLLPVPLMLLVILVLGISWLFSIVGVIIKDLREIVSVVLGLLVYLSPVVASEAMVGQTMWRYIQLNPLAHVVICFRDVFNASLHLSSWIIFTSMSLVAFLIGAWVITRTKLLINEYI